MKVLRAGPSVRRLSRTKAPPLPEPTGDADALDRVPFPRSPRFSSTMSVEAQYTILKCYEDRLVRLLSDNYPDYSSLLHRTDSPSNGHVALRRQDGGDCSSEDEEEEAEDSGPEDFQLRSTRSLPPSLYGRSAGPRPQMPQSARPDRRPNARVPHHRQLALSRRLQMAHKLLDTVSERPTGSAVKEKLNPIQGYNVWADGWREEFDVKDKEEALS